MDFPSTQEGLKQYFRCNQVSSRAKQCPSRAILLYHSHCRANVSLFFTTCSHEHTKTSKVQGIDKASQNRSTTITAGSRASSPGSHLQTTLSIFYRCTSKSSSTGQWKGILLVITTIGNHNCKYILMGNQVQALDQ